MVSLTNLTEGFAENGDVIGYSVVPTASPSSQKWQSSTNGITLAGDISGAIGTTFTPNIGTNVTDSHYIRVAATVDSVEYYSPWRQVRYAVGTAPAVADGQSWTVDDTSVNISGAASGTGLTFSYSISGVAAGVSINPTTGQITGSPTTQSSGTATITATDQYGRTYQDTFTWTATLRAQATAANGLGPYSWTVDDTSVNVNFVSDFTTNGNTLTYTFSGLSAGVVDDSDGSISGSPTTVTSGSIVCTGTDEYGRQTTSTASFTTALRTQATATGTPVLTYEEDSAITPVDLAGTYYTENGNTLVYSFVDTPPVGLSLSTSGVLSGTPTTITGSANYTLRATDEYGRTTDLEVSIEITEITSPVNPSLTLNSQTAGSGGNPDSISVTFSYAGTDTLDLYAATTPTSTPPSEAQVIAGTGGGITEGISQLGYTGGTIDLDGFTDDTVGYLHVVVPERTNGGSSGVKTIALSDIDFTPLAFTGWATDAIDGTQIIGTANDTVLGSEVPGNWTVPGHTVSGVNITTPTVTLTVTPAVANGDVDTVSYSGGNLTDERGNALAAFSGQAITNNVPSAGPSAPTYEGSVSMGFINTSSSATYTSFFPAAGTYVVPFHVRRNVGSNVILTPSGPNVTAATKLVEAGSSVFHDAEIWLVETDAASNLVMSTDATGSAGSGRIYRILADGYTATGHVEGGAGGGTPSLPDSSVTLGSAAEVGDAIVAITYFRDANGTGITWGDDAAGNEVAEEIGTAADRSSVALWVADSATAYTASAAITGSDGVHVWVSAIVALKAA